MANEFRLSYSLQYENGTLRKTLSPSTLQFPQATKGIANLSIAATTAEADVSVGGLGTPGMAILHNLEATTTGKTWLYGLKSSTGGIPTYFRLPPKQLAQVNYGTSAMVIRGKMSSGTATIDITIFES